MHASFLVFSHKLALARQAFTAGQCKELNVVLREPSSLALHISLETKQALVA